MTVVSIHVASVSGANETPGSGDVRFKDGFSCGWSRNPQDNSLSLSNYHRGSGGSSGAGRGSWYLRSFRSPKREAELAAFLKAGWG